MSTKPTPEPENATLRSSEDPHTRTEDQSASRRRAEDGSAQQPTPGPWKVEGMPGTPEQHDRFEGWSSRLPGGRWFWPILFLLLAINWVITGWWLAPPARITIPYTEFVTQLDAGNLVEISATGDSIQGTLTSPLTNPEYDDSEATAFETERPEFADDDLLQSLIDHDVVVNAEPTDQPAPLWQQVLLGFGPTLLLLYLFYSFYKRMGAGGIGALGGIGSSKAQKYEPTDDRVTFDDVAGIDEAEAELVEVVDFLRHPAKYTRLGATIPRGVLLSGAPGTGKTLLAQAVAGEAAVPFFSMAASEFVEMIVGVGASRVRDLFDQAKEAAPAIIFIDEIDGIGRARGGAMSFGGNDEKEQTLNQILTEMDGFTGNEGVIVMAATNRPDVLDPALLRPGRFDRHVVVNAPDQTGREAILGVHTHTVPLAEGVDLSDVASLTPGMVGADLRNLVNEAALMAARRGHAAVEMSDFTDALEKIVLGSERNIMMSHEARERTAYHESGHALLGILEPTADPVRKVSIIPRGRALGVTLQSPESDVYSYSEPYLLGKITGALGGRAAEELIYGDHTTGAENDIVQATQIARHMVGRWGMSDKIGAVSVLPADEQPMFSFASAQTSPETQALVDAEVRRITDECYQKAYVTLESNRGKLDTLTKALLAKETLDEDEINALVGTDAAIPAGQDT